MKIDIRLTAVLIAEFIACIVSFKIFKKTPQSIFDMLFQVTSFLLCLIVAFFLGSMIGEFLDKKILKMRRK